MRILIVLAGLLAAAPLAAQTQHGTDSGHHGHAGGHAQGQQEAQACEESFDKVIAEGRGFGMAFAADRNGYPGPLHVLELREALQLTLDQQARVRSLLSAMFAESRPKGAELLAAEAGLRRLFERGGPTEESVRAHVMQIERLRGELRLVHLRYHLKTRELLTDQQRATYHTRRWAAPPAR